jgi:ribosome-binding factor A
VTRRTERVSEQIRAELARLLREEVADPRIGLVTLTRVDLAPDFGNANVFWSALPGKGDAADRAEKASEGLARAASFLRRRLAEELPLRRVPELRFRHDPSLALGSETLGLLREIRDDEAEAGEGEGEDRER